MNKIESWKIARFLQDIKQEISDRDWYECIINKCENRWIDYHHTLFWTDVIYNETRNTKLNWVLVCRTCHEEIHATRKWQGKRQEAIDYLIDYYNNDSSS